MLYDEAICGHLVPGCICALRFDAIESTAVQLLQAVTDILKDVPSAVWAAIMAPAVSLVSVVLTLRHTSKLQAIQLAHDADERTRERQMAWRREVYLHAAESISRLSGLIGRIADLTIPDQELSRVYQDDTAKISRIQVIANDKTVAAVNAFNAEFGVVYLHLMVERGLLIAQQNEIESLDAARQGSNEAREKYESLLLQLTSSPNSDHALGRAIAVEMEIHHKKAEYCSQRRLELMNQLPKGQHALWKASLEAAFRLDPYLTPALFAVREELEMPLDTESYVRQANELGKRMRNAVGTAMHRIEDTVGDGKEEAAGAGA